MAKTIIYAAKININENIFCQNYKEMIPWIGKAVLNHNKIEYEEKNTSWVFVDTKAVELSGYPYISGKLSKVTKIKSEKKYEKEKGLFNATNENLACTSTFLLDMENEIIVFEPVTGLSKNEFLKYFSCVCNIIDCRIGELKLKLYPVPQKLDEIIESIDKVYDAEFKIIPANYRSDKGFLKLDEIMKDDEVDELYQKMKNKNGNMSIKEGSLFHQSMQMVKKAYGSCKIKFLNKNTKKRDTMDSENSIYKKRIELKDKDEDEIREEYKMLIEKVRKDNDL